jgi:dTDP-4-dehydrorhamnose 3,5-epimerase
MRLIGLSGEIERARFAMSKDLDPRQDRGAKATNQFEIVKTEIDDVFILEKMKFEDHRGALIKTFNEDAFRELKLATVFKEAVYSISKRNVLRGMHYQEYPFGHAKLVNVIEGEILDVVVGIGGQSNRGKYISVVLSKENNRSLYIPEGYAHGFLCLTETAIVSYQTTTTYNAASDTGIRFDSFGFSWPVASPIISERDLRLKRLDELQP